MGEDTANVSVGPPTLFLDPRLIQRDEHEERPGKVGKVSFEFVFLRIAMIEIQFRVSFVSKTDLQKYSLGDKELSLFI